MTKPIVFCLGYVLGCIVVFIEVLFINYFLFT